MSQGSMKTETDEGALVTHPKAAPVLWSFLIPEGNWHRLPRAALPVDVGTGVGDFCFLRAILVIA